MEKYRYSAGFKLSFLVIAGLMIISLLGACQKDSASKAQESGESRPVISIMAPLHFPHPPIPELIAEIEKQTQTKLELNWVPDGIYTDKMNTALTTNSLKKATYVKYTDYMLMKNSIRSGAFWDIGPYLDAYPNLKQLNKGILGQAAVDGNIYGLYTERPSSRQGIIIREDWLNNLKLAKPTNLDELYQVLKAFTYGDPDRNGKEDTIGLTDRNDLVFGAFKTISSYFGTPNNWGIAAGKLAPEFETQAYVDTMNYMKKLYDEKLINSDFAVTSKDVQRDKIIRGTAGAYIGSMQDVQRLSDEVQLANPQAKLTLVNHIEGPKGFQIWSIPNYSALYLFSKKAIRTEVELKQMLQFFDRTMDKDIANLMKYGLEGRHYTTIGDKVQLTEETSKLRVNEVNALYALMIADLNNPQVKQLAESESLLQLADRLSTDNEKYAIKDPTLGLESKTYDERGVELYKIISDATYNYMLGKLDQAGFQREIERWKRSGGEQIIAEYNEAYGKK
ncbi:putative ABC transporter peptide-binding protein YtcQ [Paenibacillus marchantiophytorum]|uniref:ABC transporter peptide-binding protein YtcQ n=1 Tax=Paenibacillus marchantiophytorum TaxID=1619310 RepID=A0ABQ2BUH6_9BACL|nr:extracellular solute-binding protein [Paenibacillus marchantiophytorum]GGI47092.1 putative ABC transporter peptide-binding protein YtcQ [Paenibacillus marchantiophytorum]